MANVDHNELKKDIEAIVAAIFSEKEEAEMRKKTEKALQESASTIEELTTTLSERDTEIEGLETKVAEEEEKATNLQSELEAAQSEVESLNEKLGEVQNELDEMKKDKAADIRMAELEEAGVVSSDREGQVAKVREMADEDFEAYKEELVSVRKAVLAELEAAASEEEEAEEPTGKEEEPSEEKEEEEGEEASEESESEEAAEEEEGSEEETEDETPPANIDPNKAVQAAMNMEVFVSDELTNKYRALGQAMADRFKESK